MIDYSRDISKYTSHVSEAAVQAIVSYCGIALRNRDAQLVSTSDEKELATIRDGFAAKKLGLAPDAADAAIKSAAEKMKAERVKQRVTFYYLLADASGTLDKLTAHVQHA